MQLKPVHTAFTEAEAAMVKGLLESAGIPVIVRPTRIPGGEVLLKNEWGDLLVPSDRAREAKEIITAYAGARGEEDSA